MPTIKEEIYDEKIFPLMAQVIAICKEHRIAMLFSCALGFEPDDDESQLTCTSAILDRDCEPTDEQMRAFHIIRPRTMAAVIEITDAPSREGCEP